MSDYDSWMQNQIAITESLAHLIRQCKLECVVITEPKRSPFVRLFLPDTTIDFTIKVVKNRYAKSIWLCKRKDFNQQKNYILYVTEDDTFFIAIGEDVDKEAEYRESDWKKGIKMVVVPKEIFRDAKTYFEMLYIQYDEKKQSRLTNW